jgi:hypothetical protein
MDLAQDEWIICPAIWIDDGITYTDQPKNINTGYVIYGNHMVDIFFCMTSRGTGNPIDIKSMKLNDIHEGYYTNLNRFVKAWIKY